MAEGFLDPRLVGQNPEVLDGLRLQPKTAEGERVSRLIQFYTKLGLSEPEAIAFAGNAEPYAHPAALVRYSGEITFFDDSREVDDFLSAGLLQQDAVDMEAGLLRLVEFEPGE